MQEKKSLKNLKIKKLSIVGVIPSFAFQRAKYCALELHRKLPQRFPLPEIVGLLELDWSEKLQEWRQTLGREYWCLRRPVAVFFDDRFIGSDIELIKLVTIGNILMENIPRKNLSSIKKHFRKDYISYLRKSKRIYCYLDICVDGVYAGTLTFQLYSDIVPRTCENFKTLCLGSRGPLLSYRGSRIHRIVKKGWLQGGDIQYKTGGGGFSIFCDPLEDECFGISHDRRGVLSMASGERHSNGSQFFITLQPSKWMDTNFVAFGQLIEGVKVLRTLENLETFYECPLKKVEIKSCGKLDLEDVEDVDVMYRETQIPLKKQKRIETISEQVVRLIMEALTDALARKERLPDILDDGDVPSKMNLQLYFQGFYSLPEEVLEETAAYLRNLRRQLLRVAKPSATEIVEVITYDLLMAVLTRMTTLDDVRETIGHDLYQKMISGIEMKLEFCQKSYVKRLINQIVSTAENMVNLVSKKIKNLKKTSVNLKAFQDRMQGWVQSFVLQETFQGDNYFIAERPVIPQKPPENPCPDPDQKKKEEELKAKLAAKFGPADLCCLGSKLKLYSESDLDLYKFFSTCRYDLKRVPKEEVERMPLLDLIEISRFKLKWIRKQENRVKSEERQCLEKKIRRWISEVVYTPETSWLKDIVFPKDCAVYDHIEEIMYGAMTAGLLEMYYFMEEYLKLCGGKQQKLVTTVIYPEDWDLWEDEQTEPPVEQEKEEEEQQEFEGEPEGKTIEIITPACPCGHPCCKCLFDPNARVAATPPPSLEGEFEGEIEETSTLAEPPSSELKCASDETLVDPNAYLAERLSLHPEEIDIKSLKWLKPYILEKGCDLKSEFAAQVHKWMEGERFSYRGFISKHSLATRASLLSLSISLAELIKEENNLKPDVRNFIYDLWDLYFEEMFKEALLEFPPTEEPVEPEVEDESEAMAPEDENLDECKGFRDIDFDEICGTVDLPVLTPCEGDGTADLPKDEEEEPKKETPEENQEAIQAEQEQPEKQPEKVPPEPEQNKQESQPSQEEPATQPEPALPQNEEVESEPLVDATRSEKPPPTAETKREGDEKVQEGQGDVPPVEEQVKKRKSPIVIEELVDVSSGEEVRDIPPYVLPFWVKFLTELTKQALGALANVSRLPRRLYFQSDSETAFDDKMKEWFDFNAFNPQPTKGREIMEYIALHHKNLTSLEETARSYLKKKKLSELLNRCTRFTSADDVADEIVADVMNTTMGKTQENETLELFVSNLLSTAITSSPARSQASVLEQEDKDFNTFDTDKKSREPEEND